MKYYVSEGKIYSHSHSVFGQEITKEEFEERLNNLVPNLKVPEVNEPVSVTKTSIADKCKGVWKRFTQ